MEFKKIEIEGFLSYYKYTQINFSLGNTLIIGKNNTGKSKLFDAFHWVLFNRVFDSQMEKWIESPSEVDRMVINNKLKKEAIAAHKIAVVTVSIELETEEYDNQIVTITRKNTYDFSLSSSPSISSDLAFYTQDKINVDDSSVVTGMEADDRISELFPICLRDFVLFQGEAASELMKLANKNQNTIRNAIEEISRIKLFQLATNIAESYQNSKEREINKVVKLSKENKEELDRLEAEVERKSKDSNDYSLQAEKLESDIADLTNECIDLRSYLSQYQEIINVFKDREKYKQEYDRANEELKVYKEVNKEISGSWIFYKVKNKLASFSSFYKSLESLGQVPPPIPQSEIKATLESHICSLCGNHLDDKSYAVVKSKESNDMIDRFGKTISQISFAINTRLPEIEKVPQAIKQYIDNDEARRRARESAMQKLKDAEGKLKTIQISESDDKTKAEFEEKRKLFTVNEKTLDELKKKKSRLEGRVEQLNNEITQAKSKMAYLRSQSENIDEDDKIKLAYATRICNCMKKLCNSVQDIAYEEIQEEANNYYHEMVKENPAIVGDIKIDRENSEIYTVDSLGDKILNLNTGSRILIELAVIAGILSVASRQFDTIYPFVTDAPTSQLDATNKMQTIKCMLRAFDQSVIIVKDDSEKGEESADPLRKLAIESKDIGAAYEIALTVDGSDNSIDDQYTIVRVLKECKDE